jgi:hypothetical protein
MELLRDSFWQSVGALIAILSLFLYVYVERDKISKLFSGVPTKLRSIFDRIGEIFPILVQYLRTILNALFISLLGYFILSAPIFLYEAIVKSSVIESSSMFYVLVLIVWCLSIVILSNKFTIDKLREQIDYLNRVPGIKQLKTSYSRQLFDSVMRQWNDFSSELANKHDNSPFALDLATCSPLEVRDETLIMGCPNRVIYKRMNLKPRRASTEGYDEEYEAWKIDKETIEKIIKERFQVMSISYTLEKQIATQA